MSASGERIRNIRAEEQVNNEFRIERDNLLPSLLDSVSHIPMGRSYFSYDEQSGQLSQISDTVQKTDHEIQSIAFERTDETISITSMEYVDFAQKPHELQIEFNHEGFLQYVSFKNTSKYDPQLSIIFAHDGDTLKSQAHLYMSLIDNISALTPNYSGDHKTASFIELEDYTPEQLALLFVDGQVPDMDIQTFMHDTLFLKNLLAKNSLALPTLTFIPEKNDYQPLLSNTYLVQHGDNLPEAAAGNNLEGIVIIKDTNKPYKVQVNIDHIEEKPHMYGQIQDKATHVTGTIVVFDGKEEFTMTSSFISLHRMESIKANPQGIIGSAFEFVVETIAATT